MQSRFSMVALIAFGALASTLMIPAALAQSTVNCEWVGDDGGMWYNPLDPIQLEVVEDPDPDWDCDSVITIGGVSFGTINYPNNLPGFNFHVDVGSSTLDVVGGIPMRVSNVTLGSGGLSLISGASWGIEAGTVTGGTITMNQLGVDLFFTDLTIDGNVTFTGGGTIELGNSASNRIIGGVATQFSNFLILEDYTVQGGGSVGSDSMSIRNMASSVIRANVSSVDMIIDPGQGNNIINAGLMESVNGATLNIRQTAIANAGGTISAGNGSLVEFFDSTISGGTFEGSGLIRGVGTVRLEDEIVNNGVYSTGGSNTILDGDIINNGQVTIAGGKFLFQVDTDLTGGGTFILGAGGNSTLAQVGGFNPTVTNIDNTISGGGVLGFMNFVNQSSVTADESSTPLVTLANVTNQSTFSAQGAELNIRGGFNNVAGTVSATGGTVSITNGATIVGGTIEIDGGSTLVLNNGFIRHANNADDGVTGGATVNIASGGTLAVEILDGKLDADVTIASGATVHVGPGRLTLTQTGSYLNAGTISLESDFPFDAFGAPGLLLENVVTLTGGGTIEMAASGGTMIRSVGGFSSTFVNQDNTIRGAGHIGRNSTDIENHAMIDANATPTGLLGSGILFIDPGAGGLLNDGTMQASSGGTLHLLNGTYENAGGTIQALAGATVNIDQGTHIIGGTIRSTGGSVEVLGTDILFDGVGMNLDAQINVQSNGRLRLKGNFVNAQAIDLTGGAQLIIDGQVTLTGGGSVNLGGVNTKLTSTLDGSPDLLINIDNTISGTGLIQFLDIQSGGTLAPGNSPGTLTINGSYTQTDEGTLQIEIAGMEAGEFDVLNVLGSADMSGTLEIILLAGPNIEAGATFNILTAQTLNAQFDALIIPTDGLGQDLFAFEQIGNSLQLTALVAIPEPSASVLLVIGGLTLLRRRRDS